MFAQSSKRVTLKIQTTIDLFLLQQLYPRFSKKSFVNKLLTILITTNFWLVQFGFRKNISTTDALVFTTEKIRKEIDNNHFVAAAFLELSKTFDSISHEILLKKLETLHFDQNAISLLQCFLTGRTQRVVLSTSKSDWIN